ncbi:uncharacterized protein [Thunnus thynnus]|uniref:uncharacterized protein n=1 Tax=Thunnus thynnus TaxID=8237 RepID=UPI003528BEB3
MATADQLLELIFSWIEQRERCAEKLRKLARELESLRKKCNGSECFGSSVSVAGAACLIGAGVATLFTGGAAAPALGLLGGLSSGVGLTVSLATKLTEHLISSDTMKDAQKIEQKSNDIGETIQRLLEKLKAEKRGVSFFTDPDELDQHVMTEILRAMARRSGLQWPINISSFGDGWGGARGFTGLYSQVDPTLIMPYVIIAVYKVLKCFSYQAEGKASICLIAKITEQLIKTVSLAGFKTFLKGGLAVGGAVGMVFALSHVIEDMIEKNHVTEASQSLRNTADAILEMNRTLRKQLDDIKRMLEEMEKREQEEQLRREFARKQEEEQHRREVARKQEEEQHRREVARKPEEEQPRRKIARRQQEEQLRRKIARKPEEEQLRRYDDRGDEESDSEEEESDRGDEESDSEEETEEEENKQSGGKQKKKLVVLIKTRKSDSNEENNHKFETNPSPPGSIRMGLLNVQSLTAKTEKIKELITQNSLDVFLPTETWLKRKGGDHVLRAASPENFSSVHQVRATRNTFNVNQVRKSRGGGVAIQYSQVLQGEKIKRTKKAPDTFEYVAAELQHGEWGQPVLLINVYRPPGNLNSLTQFHRFLEEFESLLDEASARYNSIIITGDFNIHVENEMLSSTTEFRQLLEKKNLVQHVEEPTHRSDHFLDLVITRNVEISDLTVQDDGISDHYTVIFNAEPVSKETDDEESTKRYKRKEE